MYRVLHKRLSDIAGKVVVVEDLIAADNALTSESGVLRLVRYTDDGTRTVKAIPPGMWFECDEAVAAPVIGGFTSIVDDTDPNGGVRH
jgi:hypothetical protein